MKHRLLNRMSFGKTLGCLLLAAISASIVLNSCNVVRTVTNRSEFYQKGDTSITIQTRTTESYDAKKNLSY